MEAATAYPFTATGALGPNNPSGFVWLHGMTLIETAGSTATAILTDATGANVAVFALTATAGLGNGIIPKVRVKGQVTVTVTGTVKGVMYIS